jgi:thioredoxin 1
MFTEIHSPVELEQLTLNEPALLAYFSTDICNVCKSLKPKIEELISENFPHLKMVFINIVNHPEIAGQQRVFTVPTILVFFEGQETIRKSRNFGINDFHKEIERPYNILFSKK